MSVGKPLPANLSLYESDYYSWSLDQAAKLRAGRFDQLDLEHLAEEIESLGRAQYWELVSRLRILLAHLLKWQYQPALRCRSWEITIIEQRDSLDDLLRDNPGLKPKLDEALLKGYRKARLLAEKETGLASATFPDSCPYTLAQVIDAGWLPG